MHMIKNIPMVQKSIDEKVSLVFIFRSWSLYSLPRENPHNQVLVHNSTRIGYGHERRSCTSPFPSYPLHIFVCLFVFSPNTTSWRSFLITACSRAIPYFFTAASYVFSWMYHHLFKKFVVVDSSLIHKLLLYTECFHE